MKNSQTAEQKFITIAAQTAAPPETATPPDKPIYIFKRIGNTTYRVAVHFSTTSKENISDKISRIIRNEIDCEVTA